MKLKTGPLVVIGALVLLVGLTMILTPAPPPAQTGEQEKEQEAKKATKKQEPPKLEVADVKQLLEAEDPKAISAGMDKLQEGVVTTRDAARKAAFIAYAKTLAQSDKREAVRLGALNVLKGVADLDPAVPMSVAKTDSSPQVREAALLSLGRFPAGGPVEATLRQFAKDPDPGLRNAAMISLTGMLSAAGKVGNEGLVSLLGQQDNDAAAKAALSLQGQGEPALPVAIKALYEGKTGPQREGAATVVSLICAGFNPSIDEFARQAQVTHRQEAGHRKANLAGLEPLMWALKNDNYAPTREIAAQGLGYLGDARAAAPLAAALKDKDAYVRRRAAAALITTPAGAVVPQLSEAAIKDTVPEVRRFAVEALGWVGGMSVVPALNQATKDPEPSVRRYAAIQLGRIADPAALESLSQLLGAKADPDEDVRWAAVTALGKLRDKRAERVLVQCLKDPSPQVSNSAERALQKLGIASKENAGFRS
ncbi:MAG: HEAT repeat domain-containing protein [Bacteroidota bacterium]